MENFHTSKALGQNFLSDPSILDEIVEASGAGEEDLVIEIGPGLGTLTSAAAEAAGKVIAIEIDDRLIPILHKNLAGYLNVEILHEDILKVDLEKLIEENKGDYKSIRFIGNLPYYITTPILMKVLEAKLPIESFTIMVQKEVAERLAAGPGNRERGAISAMVQYYADIEYVRTVEREYFKPAPKVDSAVICLNICKEPKVSVKDEAEFFALIKQSFSQKRKTLANSLAGYHGLDKAAFGELLTSLGIDPMRRAETLSLEEFSKIANAI